MILIKDVSTIEVKPDSYGILRNTANDGCEFLPRSQVMEEIHGRRFVNSRGETVCIGASKAVQETIGLLFERFENDNNTISGQHSEIIKLRREINNKNKQILDMCVKLSNITNMSIWKRILFVFLPIRTLKGV